MRPGRMEVCPSASLRLGRPPSASCWVDEENAAQGLGGLSSRELLSCPSRPEWLRLECDFEPGGDRYFSGLGRTSTRKSKYDAKLAQASEHDVKITLFIGLILALNL